VPDGLTTSGRSSEVARKKQRAYRKRQACGVAVLRVETPLYPLVEAMLIAGRLTPEQALCRGEVERQVGTIVEEWRRQWAAYC
jgi:hypothetical protein